MRVETQITGSCPLSGTNTIAVMSGAECYESLSANFKDCWEEINQIINDGKVEISTGQSVPVEIFLGGDYKVREAAF